MSLPDFQAIKENSSAGVIACLPVYNAESFIVETLQCLTNQSYQNFRVLISDDCSTDRTVSIIQTVIKDDGRFILIEQDKNLGWVDNVNFLMSEAVTIGTYVFIYPHDDLIEPDYIKQLAQALDSNPSAAMAFCDLKVKSKVFSYTELHDAKTRTERLKILIHRKGIWWIAYRGLCRSEVIKKVIPLEKNVLGSREWSADFNWIVKIAIQGNIVRVPVVLYTKRYHGNNFSNRLKPNIINYYGNMIACSLILFKGPFGVSEQFSYQFIIFGKLLKRPFKLRFLRKVVKKIIRTFLKFYHKGETIN